MKGQHFIQDGVIFFNEKGKKPSNSYSGGVRALIKKYGRLPIIYSCGMKMLRLEHSGGEFTEAKPLPYSPTGTCFDDAMFTAVQILQENPTDGDEILITHALIKNDGKEISHAWVEHKGKCMHNYATDLGNICCSYTEEEFYAEIDFVEARKYPISRLIKISKRVKDLKSGPYLLKYKKACRDYTEEKP